MERLFLLRSQITVSQFFLELLESNVIVLSMILHVHIHEILKLVDMDASVS